MQLCPRENPHTGAPLERRERCAHVRRSHAAQVRNPKGDDREPPKAYTFDQVYDHTSTQIEVFDITAKPIIDSVMEGYNGTIFAYGQVRGRPPTRPRRSSMRRHAQLQPP